MGILKGNPDYNDVVAAQFAPLWRERTKATYSK